MQSMIQSIQKPTSSSPSSLPLKLRVELVEDGEKGWDKLKSGEFDIAIVDIYLPGGMPPQSTVATGACC